MSANPAPTTYPEYETGRGVPRAQLSLTAPFVLSHRCGLRLLGRIGRPVHPRLIEPPVELELFQPGFLALRARHAVQVPVFLCLAGIHLARQTFAFASQVDDFCHGNRYS